LISIHGEKSIIEVMILCETSTFNKKPLLEDFYPLDLYTNLNLYQSSFSNGW